MNFIVAKIGKDISFEIHSKDSKLLVMKTVFSFLIVLAIGANSFGQIAPENVPESKSFAVEVFAMPLPIGVSGSIGVSYKAGAFEQQLKVSSYTLLTGMSAPRSSLSLYTSSNLYLRGSKNYIPIWLGVNNILRDLEYEEGYFPHLLRPSIGTGFGRRWEFTDRIHFRTEVGLGASINLVNFEGGIRFYENLSNYGFDQSQYSYQNPKVLPDARLNLGLLINL